MFNRAFKVQMIKTPKNAPAKADILETTCEGKTAIIAVAIDKSLKKIGTAVVAYVVVDTLRKVLVAKASK